jgi:uncharacterized phage-like protein YoqJ
VTLCFTGHRPDKLSTSEVEVRDRLKTAIDRSVSEGYTRFITGMARGVDLWAGEAVLDLKASGKSDLELVAAVPYRNVADRWPSAWRNIYLRIISEADEVHYTSEKYYRFVYISRDQWMVNNSSRVLAFYEGIPGGTEYTINYAVSLGKEVVYI